MQNFQNTFETRKRTTISAFSILMIVPLREYNMRNIFLEKSYKLYTKLRAINKATDHLLLPKLRLF